MEWERHGVIKRWILRLLVAGLVGVLNVARRAALSYFKAFRTRQDSIPHTTNEIRIGAL